MLGLADLEKGLLRELTPCCTPQGHPERWRRRAVGLGVGEPSRPFKVSSVAHSLPGGPSGVSGPDSTSPQARPADHTCRVALTD